MADSGEAQQGKLPTGEERRKGEDRRQGDRRSGGDRRGGSVSVTGSHSAHRARGGLFDNPVYLVGAVAVGLVLGIVIMSMTDSGKIQKTGLPGLPPATQAAAGH